MCLSSIPGPLAAKKQARMIELAQLERNREIANGRTVEMLVSWLAWHESSCSRPGPHHVPLAEEGDQSRETHRLFCGVRCRWVREGAQDGIGRVRHHGQGLDLALLGLNLMIFGWPSCPVKSSAFVSPSFKIKEQPCQGLAYCPYCAKACRDVFGCFVCASERGTRIIQHSAFDHGQRTERVR